MAERKTAGPVTVRAGLRLRLTMLSAALLALVGGLLLVLSYLLVSRVVAALPQLPAGTPVIVDGKVTDAADLTAQVVDDGRHTVLLVGLLAFVVETLSGAGVAWVLIGRTLRPLSTLTRAAQSMSESSLDQRIALDGPRDEVAVLADTFDDMTARLQASFEAERRFVANASHELRTPLAVIRTEIDVTLADPEATIEDLRRMGEVARDATDRADRLVSALLVLARTQSQGLSEVVPVDLSALPGPALAAVEVERAAKDLTVTVDAPTVVVPGDRVLLERLVGNLVENAVRHNVSGGWIRIAVHPPAPGALAARLPATADRSAEIAVASSGPAIDVDSAAQLFEPFRQGGRSRTERRGAGLGLSIVAAIAAAHGGSASAAPTPGGGLTVTVRLPAERS